MKITYMILALFFNADGEVIGSYSGTSAYDDYMVCRSDIKLLWPYLSQEALNVGGVFLEANCIEAHGA